MSRDLTVRLGINNKSVVREELDTVTELVDRAFALHKEGRTYALSKDMHAVQRDQITSALERKLQVWYAEEAEKSNARVAAQNKADSAAGVTPEESITSQWG